jgi:CBS domain containing-hemolysin-like protein
MTGESMVRSRFTNARAAAARLVAAAWLSAATTPASASLLSGEALDTAATAIAWFVVCVVPIAVIVLFWMVHVLPEKIAEKRHHPQKDAIHTLCLLSLVFGGLLWPIAWLWAYTKPVGYRLAYGTEKHDNYYLEMGEKAKSGALLDEEIVHLRQELDAMAAKGTLPATLRNLRDDLDALPIEPTDGVKAGVA